MTSEEPPQDASWGSRKDLWNKFLWSDEAKIIQVLSNKGRARATTLYVKHDKLILQGVKDFLQKLHVYLSNYFCNPEQSELKRLYLPHDSFNVDVTLLRLKQRLCPLFSFLQLYFKLNLLKLRAWSNCPDIQSLVCSWKDVFVPLSPVS